MTNLPASPELLSLDLYNTLFAEDSAIAEEARARNIVSCLEANGARADEHHVRKIVAGAYRRYQAAWATGGYYPPQAAASDIAADVCLAAGISDTATERAIAEACLACGGDAELTLTSGAYSLLAAARRAGIGTCVVCDIGLTPSERIWSFLERAGLAQLIGATSFSDETAVYKPAAEAFLRAWRAYPGLAGSQIWHVGDMRRSDTEGAARLGAVTVRFSGIYDDTDPASREADVVVGTLSALERLIRSA